MVCIQRQCNGSLQTVAMQIDSKQHMKFKPRKKMPCSFIQRAQEALRMGITNNSINHRELLHPSSSNRCRLALGSHTLQTAIIVIHSLQALQS